MVQQPPAVAAANFVGAIAAVEQHAAQTNGVQVLDSTSSLAVPAIIATHTGQQQASAQCSPQASLYQQQLIKSAHQFAQQQQTRLNGLGAGAASSHLQPAQYSASSQQNSPQQQQQQHHQTSQSFVGSPQENFYGATSNGHQQQQQQLARPAPTYAPKPTYYGQIGQQSPHTPNQSQMYQTATRPISQQPQQVGFLQHQHQQQQAPQHQMQSATLGRQPPAQQKPILQNAGAPVGVPQAALEQQQRQMQHLVMSYQQQQEQQLQLQLQLQLQHQNSYLNQSQRPVPAHVLNCQLGPGATPAGNFWPVVETQPPPVKPALDSHRSRAHQRAPAPLSDRDSVSTVSRFNQLDERRSFTMRSQYTTNPSNKSASHFGFATLTGEAVRQIFGIGGGGDHNKLALAGQRRHSPNAGLIANEQLRQNFGLAAATGAAELQKFGGAKVTVIDSGDERAFGREVLACRLAIMRLLNLLLSAVVLLSPVAMLLVPKMEPLIRAVQEPPGSSLEYNAQEPSLAPPSNVVTHAVGLAGQRQLAKAAAASQQQQPQWRISECQSDCDGPLIGFFARLIMLALAHWAIFFRPQTATLPRADFQRCLLISLALLITSAYWLFFVFRVFDKRFNDFELHYMTIVQFAISLLETLILLHYLALALIEWRHRKRVYCLKVVRSPDGQSKYYSCGLLSIQKCAQFVLEKYHRDFAQFDLHKQQLLASEAELARRLLRQRQRQAHERQPARTTSPRRPSEGLDDEADERNADEGRAERRPSRRSKERRHHRRRHSAARLEYRDGKKDEEEEDDDDGEADDYDDEEEEDRDRRRSPSRSRRADQTDDRRKRKRSRADRSSDADDDERASTSGRRTAPGRPGTAAKTNESAEQSSDATSRMKESSLETVRAAAGTTTAGDEQLAARAPDIEISERPAHAAARGRDDAESVRSGRSRRSTGSRLQRGHRPESRHHHARHERVPSRTRAHTAIEVASADEQTGGAADEPLDELERKLRRRKLRLLAAVEDSFEQVRLLDEGAPAELPTSADQVGLSQPTAARPAAGLDAGQLARALYPSIARPLQKYLRLTKQTGRHNLQSIYEHLSKCLLYKLSARAFLEKFTSPEPVWQQSETSLFAPCRLFRPGQKLGADREPQLNSWSLICDTLLSRQIDSGTFFLLKQGQVSLLVSVARLPHLDLSEQVVDQNSCRFALGPSPETTSV